MKLRSDRKDSYYNYTLLDARKAAGYTLQELADITSINVGSLSHYERLRATPPNDSAAKIAKALDKSVQELFPVNLPEMVAEIKTEREGGFYRQTLNKVSADPSDWRKKSKRSLKNLIHPFSLERISEKSCGVTDDDIVEEAGRGELRTRISYLVASLPYRHREVLKYRYGIDNAPTSTLEEVAERLHITRERVRQLEFKALERLRNDMLFLESFMDERRLSFLTPTSHNL